MAPDDGATTINVDPDQGLVWSLRSDGKEQATEADGTIIIRDRVPTKKDGAIDPDEFYENLADGQISESELSRIAAELIEGIDADNQSRVDWLNNAAEAIKLLGLRIEPMRSSGADGAAPLEGMSTAHSPLLLEAVLKGQAQASGELLPAAGPVKVKNDTPPRPKQIQGSPLDNQGSMAADQTASILGRVRAWLMGDPIAQAESAIPPQPADTLANDLQTELNHYLTSTASEYYPDTRRMLFRTYLFGSEFKKVYNCPIRMRPVSESVPANELIVNNGATDLRNATRVTHRIRMNHSTLVRMQVVGAYRRKKIAEQPTEGNADAVDRAAAVVEGRALFSNLPADARHTIMECYCELDIQGHEHKDDDGDYTGLPLPYKVSIDYETREVLEVRRDWDPAAPGLPQRRRTFVKFTFVEALGFYGLGLMHLLGNTTNTMTSVWRLLLDSLMFGNFPGFLYADSLGKQLTNIFRVPPGAGAPIQLNGQQDIRQVAMPMPYSKPDAVSIQFANSVEAQAQRLGGTADTPVAEGKQNAPVGTTLALIEQAGKILDSVHKGLYASQAEEFQLFVERFREDPEALWRFRRKPARKWEVAEFLQALDECDITPAADPNTPSQMHRIMRAVARVQLAAMAPPGMVDLRAVLEATFRTLGDDPGEFMPDPSQMPPAQPPGPPPADQVEIAKIQAKGAEDAQEHQARMAELGVSAQQHETELQMKGAEAIVESRDRAADRASREAVANTRLLVEKVKALQNLIDKGQLEPAAGARMIQDIEAGNPTPPPAAAPPQPASPQGSFRQPGPGTSPGEAMWTRPL